MPYNQTTAFLLEPTLRPRTGEQWYEWDDNNDNIVYTEGTSFGLEYRDGKTLIWNIEDECLAMIFHQILSLSTVTILGRAYGVGWVDGCAFGRANPEDDLNAINPTKENDEMNTVMTDPAASGWVKTALESALKRDPVDAVNDAEFLLAVLTRRLDNIFRQAALSSQES
jgi:hypothetical protein